MNDRRIGKARAAFKNTVIARLTDHLKIIDMYFNHLQAVSDKLASPNHTRQKKQSIQTLFLSTSSLLESICEKACGTGSWTWWKDPDNHADGFDAFCSSSFLTQHELSEVTHLCTGFALLQESLLHLFYADSFKVVITYSGFTDSKVNGRRALWKCDARKARLLASQIQKLSLGNQELNDSIERIFKAAEHLENFQPSEGIAKFEYSYTELTYSASSILLPKNALAKSKTLPLRKVTSDSPILTTGILGRSVTYIPYPVFSAYLNKLKLTDYIDFLIRKSMYDNVTKLWSGVLATVSKIKAETQENIAQQKGKPLNEWPVFLFDAVAIGDLELVKESLRFGENVNKKNAKDWTPFLVAVANDSVEIAQFLLNENADITQNLPNGWTPMMLATKKGSRRMIELLLPYDDKDWEEHIREEKGTIHEFSKWSCALLITALVFAFLGWLLESIRTWSFILACLFGIAAIFAFVCLVAILFGLMKSRKMQARYEAIKREIGSVRV